MKTVIFLLWLFCAKCILGLDDTFTKPLRYVSSDTDDVHSADFEEADVVLNENGNPRDKRTLGFIVQGLANVLGFTVTPVQIASLPNPSPPPPAPSAPKMPLPRPKAPVPAPPPRPPPVAPPAKAPAPPPPKSPAPPPQSRQRETIRITGLVNFGPNANSNLPAQLGQYEQLFHGTVVGAAPAPAPVAPAPPAPARPSVAPVPKPILAKIPSPIVPNLSPLLPHSRPPTTIPGNIPTKQEVETEYRKQENSEKYNVDNKEIQGVQNPYFGSHGNAYTQEPNWQQEYIVKLRELEERQKEYADKLEKHDALLVKQQQDHENTDGRFVNREKEILERDKSHHDQLRNRERENISQKEKESSKTDDEDSIEGYEEGDEPYKGYAKPSSSESEEKRSHSYEDEEEMSPKEYFEYNEGPKKYPGNQDYAPTYGAYNDDEDEKLLNSKDKEVYKLQKVRNSHGESFEDQGKINDNIADYFVKFKDPKTGLYVPEKIQNTKNYNKDKEPWWNEKQGDFDSRIEHLRTEYSSPAPESKYEEYELEAEPEEDGKSTEKLELSKEADERSSQSNDVRKIPDYSEAFGGHEAYVEKLEPKQDQEIVSPSVDIAESPRSEFKQKSNGESEEPEKYEDNKEIPFYHFDFKNFMPYHSPIKYFYGYDDAEKGIPEVKSYNHNSKAPQNVEPTKEDIPVKREESTEVHQPTIGLPEKLSIQNLHNGESKQLRAWPAPFDYIFDSTEQTNVAELSRIQSSPETEVHLESEIRHLDEGPQATSVEHLVPEYGVLFRRPHGIRQQEHHPESFHGHLITTENLQAAPENLGFQEYARFSSALDGTTRQSQVPLVSVNRYNSQEDNRQIDHAGRNQQNTINQKHILQPTELQNQPFSNNQRGYEADTSTGDGSTGYLRNPSSFSTEEENYEKSRQPYQPVESQYHSEIPYGDSPVSHNGPKKDFGPRNADLRNRGQDFSQHYMPVKPHPSIQRSDENPPQPQNKDEDLTQDQEDKSSLKFDDPQSAHDFFGFSPNDYDYENKGKNEKSQSIVDNDESLDLLVVPDPMPYQYDLRLTEYTDEPESDTEKVKVKEYRNKVSTVTVSQNKQLSPEGPVYRVGYSNQY